MRHILVAFRRLARRPSFTMPAVATLAVGVGATTAIFSAVNAALLRPLPYPHADQIYLLRTARTDGLWSNGDLSSAELTAITEGAPSVTAAAGMMGDGTEVLITDDGRNRRLSVRTVTDGFFDLAGVPLALGRSRFLEGTESSYGAVVISDRLWEQQYARDPDILGSLVRFPSGSATIVGVAAPEFDLPHGTDMWFIFSPGPASESKMYTGLLQVRADVAPEGLNDELDAVMSRRVAEGLDPGAAVFIATPLLDSIVGDLGPILWIVFAAATILLALGCANVAALILARGGAQTRELAVRKALGASYADVSRQLLTESLILSTLGTAIGLALAGGGLHLLSTIGVDGLPRLDRVTFDPTVLLVSVATLAATAMLIGLLPMMSVARTDVRSMLGGGGRPSAGEGRSKRLLSGIVVAEIALAIVLVTSAGWLVRSYANLTETDPGFEAEGRIVFQTMLLGSSYQPIQRIVHTDDGGYLVDDTTGQTPKTWLRDLRSGLDQIDEVRGVAFGSRVPFRQDPPGVSYVSVPGRISDPDAPDQTRFRFVSPDFFAAMGIPILAGRTFTDVDPRTNVIVNEAFVRTYLAGRDPIGSTFETGYRPDDFTSERTIVGVVADVRYRSLRDPEPPAFYIHDYLGTAYVVISTSADDVKPLIPRIRAIIDAVEPGIPITIQPLDEVMSTELARHRLGLVLMSLFAAVSLLLAGIGIHGVVGHGTSLRSTEFAVRIAVGARPITIARSVLQQGGVLWLMGIALGVVLAYVTGRLGSSQLYEVQASDPAILVVAVAAVSLLTLVAFSLSAYKGSRVEPGKLLKAE